MKKSTGITSAQTTTEQTLQDRQKYAVYLMESLEKMKRVVENKSCPVHRNILRANSEYFDKMLSSDMKEANDGFVDMKDIDPDAMEVCIDYMYTGEAKLTAQNMHDVAKVADMIQFRWLTNSCAKFMMKNLTAENCLVVKSFAESLQLRETARAAETFTKENFAKVISTKHFVEIELIEFLSYIDTKDIRVNWEGAMKWVKHDARNRKSALEKIIQTMQLENAEIQFICGTMWKETLVRESVVCSRKVASAIFTRKRLTITNFICFELLQMHSAYPDLSREGHSQEILRYMAEHFSTTSSSPMFLDLSKDNVVYILDNARKLEQKLEWFLYYRSDPVSSKNVLESALKWAKADPENRSTTLPELLKIIGLQNLDEGYIKNKIMRDGLIKQSLECQHLIVECLMQRLIAPKAQTDA